MYRFICLCIFLFPLTTGCIIPEFQHPLSDSESSIIDKRVIGYWEQVEVDEDGKEKRTTDNKAFHKSIIFGKHADRDDVMIVARTILDDDGTVEHESRVATATKLDETYYFSWILTDDEMNTGAEETTVKSKAPVFYVTRYSLSDNNKKMTLYMLDPKKIIEALQEGRLAGVVEEKVKIQNGKETSEVTRVIIESTTRELRDFFRTFGDTLFNTEEPIYYRKRTPKK